MKADALCYMNDDVLFYENTIENLINSYQKYYPQFDGIMGMNQSNLPRNQIKETAFGIIGKEFAEQFPNRQVFCPEYWRFFGDEELLLYVKSINKLIFDENVKIIHLHGAFYKDLIDSTHLDVRKYWRRDKRIFDLRRQKGFLWGKDFELIGENNGF